MKKTTLYKTLVGIQLAALIWGPALFIGYLSAYLRNNLYIYTGWKVSYVYTAALILTVVIFVLFYRKWEENFSYQKPVVIVLSVSAIFLALFSLTGTVMPCVAWSLAGGYLAVKNTERMKMEREDIIAEVNYICRLHFLCMIIISIIYIISLLLNVQYLEYMMISYGFDSVWKAGAVVLSLNFITCMGMVMLYRVIFLNVASRCLDQK